jgi:hypothetical protein
MRFCNKAILSLTTNEVNNGGRKHKAREWSDAEITSPVFFTLLYELNSPCILQLKGTVRWFTEQGTVKGSGKRDKAAWNRSRALWHKNDAAPLWLSWIRCCFIQWSSPLLGLRTITHTPALLGTPTCMPWSWMYNEPALIGTAPAECRWKLRACVLPPPTRPGRKAKARAAKRKKGSGGRTPRQRQGWSKEAKAQGSRRWACRTSFLSIFVPARFPPSPPDHRSWCAMSACSSSSRHHLKVSIAGPPAYGC